MLSPFGKGWEKTEGGAFVCGPYMLSSRVDGRGWNATALFEFRGDPEPENTSVQIALACETVEEAAEAASIWHRNVFVAAARAGLA